MRERQFAAALGSIVAAAILSPSILSARELSFEDRVAAQKAIEHVYWNHRIWPKENPQPKPEMSTVLGDDAIRATVEDYIEKSNALETWWHRPITGAQLQAEMTRMAANSRDPRVLQEVFAALGNDPFVIAETLARETLVDRQIRSWYASDPRFHADVRARAVAALGSCANVDCMKSLGGDYRQATLKLHSDETEGEDAQQLDALASRFSTDVESTPSRRLSRLEELADSFVVSAVLSRQPSAVTVASVSWPKRSFDAWWSGQRQPGSSLPGATASFVFPTITSAGCTNDTWAVTDFGVSVPDARYGNTAIWTGTEMIVWGGENSASGYFNTGGRYNPSIDAWNATSVGVSVPSGRGGHSAVWTGREMIVWGGYNGSTYFDTGARYDPATNSWIATAAGPAARSGQTAVWTGTEMIVWGGGGTFPNVLMNTGGRYNPSTDSWIATSTAQAPANRDGHTAVWTGKEMIVWGGIGCTQSPQCSLGDGSGYDPTTDAWTSLPLGPPPRSGHSAVWTGTDMIVWGGLYSVIFGGNYYLIDGARYDPLTGIWTTTSTGSNVPDGRHSHSAVWTGARMIVWGGVTESGIRGTGGSYVPLTNSWTTTSTVNAPSARIYHTATWSGSEMIIWGGSPLTTTGGRYCGCLNTRTVHRDADGDGYGDPATSTPSNCDGTVPAGYVLNGSDCNDADASVFPNAPEINNGADEQCSGDNGFGAIDEISGTSGFFTAGDTTQFSWAPQSGATSYDVARSTARNFSSGCALFSSNDTFVIDTESPASGTVFYYLVRSSAPNVGSWGQASGGLSRAGACLTP